MWYHFDGNEWLCNIRCVYVELLRSWFVASWFEVLRDFNWLPGLYGLKLGNLIAWRSFLHLNSYNLVGSVTRLSLLLGPRKTPQRVRGELLYPVVYSFRSLVHGVEQSTNSGEGHQWRRCRKPAPAGPSPVFSPEALSHPMGYQGLKIGDTCSVTKIHKEPLDFSIFNPQSLAPEWVYAFQIQKTYSLLG